MSIDTSTLDGKIAVMKAAREGADIESKKRFGNEEWRPSCQSWNWSQYNYRIAPKPREFVVCLTNTGHAGNCFTKEHWALMKPEVKKLYTSAYECVTVQEKDNA